MAASSRFQKSLRHADSEVAAAALRAIEPVAVSSQKGIEKDPAEASNGKGEAFKGKGKGREKGKGKDESKGKGKRRW